MNKSAERKKKCLKCAKVPLRQAQGLRLKCLKLENQCKKMDAIQEEQRAKSRAGHRAGRHLARRCVFASTLLFLIDCKILIL